MIEKYEKWLKTLKEITALYSGRTIDNIITDINAVLKELKKLHYYCLK